MSLLSLLLGGGNQQTVQTISPTVDASAVGVFNIASSKYGASPSASAATNAAALQSAFNDLNTRGGGRILIPNMGAAYQIAGQINPGAAPGEIIGIGKPILSKVDGGRLFNFSGVQSNLGYRIEGFKIVYQGSTGVAIYTTNCQNIRGRDLWFGDCSACFFDNQSVACGLEDFTVQNDTQAGIVICDLEGSQDYLRGGIIRQAGIFGGGPVGCTAILCGSVSTAYIDDNHIADHDFGLVIGNQAQDVFGTNNRVDAYTNALIIKPNGGTIYRVKLAKFVGRLTNSSTAVDSGCIIDPHTGSIDDVELTACNFAGFGKYGIDAKGGTNIKLMGGYSRGNLLGGVLAEGAAIKAIGHDCLGAVSGGSAAQAYGMIVTSGSIWALGCDLSGNVTAPTHVTGGTGTFLNCPPVS